MAEGARLESVYTARYPGFESLSLRHDLKKPGRLTWCEFAGLLSSALSVISQRLSLRLSIAVQRAFPVLRCALSLSLVFVKATEAPVWLTMQERMPAEANSPVPGTGCDKLLFRRLVHLDLLIGFHIGEMLKDAARPADLYVAYHGVGAQAEVDTLVAAGQV